MVKISIFIQFIFLLLFIILPVFDINSNSIIIELLWLISIIFGIISIFFDKKNKLRLLPFFTSIILLILYILGIFLEKM